MRGPGTKLACFLIVSTRYARAITFLKCLMIVVILVSLFTVNENRTICKKCIKGKYLFIKGISGILGGVVSKIFPGEAPEHHISSLC